jgi:small subunit ribosomal protein S16
MVVIRLRREGKRNRAFFRIVAADSSFPRDGRFLEIIGTYDPFQKKEKIKLDVEKFKKWRKYGAQISNKKLEMLIKKQYPNIEE